MNPISRLRLGVLLAFLSGAGSAGGQAVADSPALPQNLPESAPSTSLASLECKTNLNRLFEAIQDYYELYQDWPGNLTDLHPEFIADLSRFICPETLRSGDFASPRRDLRSEVFEDPLPKTYTYELVEKPYPLWAGIARTDREFKLRQRSVIGSNVPIVRCTAHTPRLNLSIGGTIYENKHKDWEDNFTSLRNQLLPGFIFRDLAPLPGRFTNGISPRPPGLDSRMVDLSRHYTCSMRSPWLWRNSGNDLVDLPDGAARLSTIPVELDLRGIIQLGANGMIAPFPAQSGPVPVQARGHALHFLEGAVVETIEKTLPLIGTEIGYYVVRYEDGHQLRIPILYGPNVLSWEYADADPTAHGAKVAWQGPNRKKAGQFIRLYHQRWQNPRPEVEIATLEFVSSMTSASPFLIAATLEP